MKNIAFLTGVLSAMIVMGTHETSGQYTWTKDPGNPVLSGGGTGAWDANVGVPWVLFNADSGRFEMWYTGSPPNCRIGFAVSNDGISWTKDTDPVLNPTPGTWDSLLVAGPCVLRESGQYRMWYTGAREPSGGSQLGLDRIGYATSPDGRHWTKYAGNPVLGPGAAPWESKGVEFCSVLPVDGGYQMYYGGFSTTGVSLIGRAFSTDGITWKRDTSNNPVLNIGAPGAWDQQVYLPRVLALGGRDYIWYTAEAVPGGGSSKIGLATSTDGGKTWTRYDAAPVVSDGPSGSWDAEYVEIGSVLAKDGMVQMWYDGGRAPEYTARVGHATAHRLDPMVLHVPSQYGTIQSAIDAAIKGDTVLVDHGTYFQNIRYRGKAIVVGSRYLLDGDTAHISRTVIDGSKPANPDSASVVSFVSGEDTGSVLCGFTITGGTGILGSFGVGIEYRGGGGVFCKGSGAILKHNFIRGNTLEGLASYHCVGAGVFADSGAGSPAPLLRLEDNIITGNSATATNLSIGGVGVFLYRINALLHGNAITDNTGITASTSTWVAGGGIYCEQSTLVCQDNLIARNKAVATQLSGTAHASGGGMAAEAVNLDFRRNRVIDNLAQGPASPGAWGGGILVFAANTSELRNIAISGNWFSGNQALGGSGASGGGIDVWNQKPRIENNMVVKNEAYNGGGIGIHGSLESSPAVAVNNTISDNNATMGGGARFRNGTIAVAFNNIFWADSATSSGPEIEASNATVSVNYCDVQGGWPTGTGNIDADPKFRDAEFRITIPSSPCREAGIDSVEYESVWYRAPATSFFWWWPRPNPKGTRPDIGAAEDPWPVDVPDSRTANLPSVFALEQNYPNPFNPATVIRYEVPSVAAVKLVVYDLLGRAVAVLANETMAPGRYEVRFDATGLASGVYLCRLTAGDFAQTRKMVVLR